ncbi:MAG: pyrroline-5-carboxylate reductase [Acidimicrobiia bacterium]|nr:pyrroline-5-carboxylate reductase [Acidimicrobiia bacterium]
MVKLQLIGGGKMGEALLVGLVAAGWAQPEELRVVEKLPARRDELSARLNGVEIGERPGPAEGVVIAVKPGDVPAACTELAAAGLPSRLLSVAAGVTIPALEAALGSPVAVIRAMPNTPALVGAGIAAIAPGSCAGPDDLDWAAGILGAVGKVVRVNEPQLDAVTGLSGSGPAYVFLVAEALIEAGVLVGLPRPVAESLALETIAGSGRLLIESGRSPADLRADVTSPGGTTAAGLRALEDRAVRAAFLDAVQAATARSAELGRS